MKQSIDFDHENGNTLWWDAVCQDMKNVHPEFEPWGKPEGDIPPGYQDIKCHLIFDIKMGENFRQKARFVAGGNMPETPTTLTYASVVSRDSVCIELTITALNGLDILSCDIHNAYLTAECREKICTNDGPDFGSEAGTIMIIRMALYCLNSSGTAFHAHLAETLNYIGFLSTKADPGVWCRPAVKPNGFEYYEYILCYVDDILCISRGPGIALGRIQSILKFKGDNMDQPKIHLGAQVGNMIVDGEEGWFVENVEQNHAKSNQLLPIHCKTPIMSGYRPETDTSPEIKAEGVTPYQEVFRVLRWAVELGRVDILLETALMSTYLPLLCRGHLKQIFHNFGYLKMKPKRKLCFDPHHPAINERSFAAHGWYDLYRYAKEDIPADAPTPRGNVVPTHYFVDSDHAGDMATRISQTGVLILVNKAPIQWYSNRKNTVETSMFSSEFIALNTATELVEALRYKLRMFGIPIEGPTNMFCNNEAVYKNASTLELTLKKKKI